MNTYLVLHIHTKHVSCTRARVLYKKSMLPVEPGLTSRTQSTILLLIIMMSDGDDPPNSFFFFIFEIKTHTGMMLKMHKLVFVHSSSLEYLMYVLPCKLRQCASSSRRGCVVCFSHICHPSHWQHTYNDDRDNKNNPTQSNHIFIKKRPFRFWLWLSCDLLLFLYWKREWPGKLLF